MSNNTGWGSPTDDGQGWGNGQGAGAQGATPQGSTPQQPAGQQPQQAWGTPEQPAQPNPWDQAPYSGMPTYASAPPPAPGSMVIPGQETLENGAQPAEYWQRLLARLIDAAISIAIFLGLWAVLGDFMMKMETTNKPGNYSAFSQMGPGYWIWAAFSFLAFEVAMVAIFGGQIGKLIMGIRVARHPQGTVPIGWGWAFLRALLFQLGGALCCGIPTILFCLSPLWGGPLVRGWHDQLCKDVVIKKPRA